MDTFIAVLLFGISYGFILFLLATGLSMTMGLMRIINMAHGAIYMVGAYVGVAAAKYTGNYLIGVLAGAAAGALIGLILETGFLRRLYKQEQSQVLLTIGFIYIMINLVQWIWGAYPLSGIVPKVFSGTVPIGTTNFPIYRLFLIGFGLVMAVLLWLFQDKTKIGATVRAGMDNREITGALGINLKVIFTGIFVLGTLVAGFCGFMGAPLTGVNLGIGWDALLLSLIVVVVGGSGSIQGALLGGLIIGLLNAFGTAYFPQIAYYIVYIALILILLLRPSGLLGRKLNIQNTGEQLEKSDVRSKNSLLTSGKAGALAEEKPNWQTKLHTWLPYMVAVLLLAILPTFLSTYFQSMMTKVLIFAIFAMSLDLIMGYTGLISFGHAAFLGTAGYMVGILIVHFSISSFWIVVPVALAATILLAAVIGYISLRVSGVYFLLVTMAFGQLLSIVATQWMSVTGGTDGLVGIPHPNLGISDFSWTSAKYYYLVLIFFIICYFVLNRIVKSSFGRSLVGIRENEERMRSLGYNTWSIKYVAIILAGLFAGVAGILFAYHYGAMVPSYLALETSALPMLMVIIGGAGTLYGPALGAAVIVLIQQYSTIYVPARWPLILGSIFVICVMLVRGGFATYLSRLWQSVSFRKTKPVEADHSIEADN